MRARGVSRRGETTKDARNVVGEGGELQGWNLISRFGEVQALILVALLAILSLLRRRETRSVAWRWIWLLSIALVLTIASKVMFMAWGVGWPALQFSGVSGHAMCAAAVYPMLMTALTLHLPPLGRQLAMAAGYALAFCVGASRLALDAHSTSEVVAGLLVGAAASAPAMDLLRLPRMALEQVVLVAPALMLALVAGLMPTWQAESMLARMSSTISGHNTAHTRCDFIPSRCLRPRGRPGAGDRLV